MSTATHALPEADLQELKRAALHELTDLVCIINDQTDSCAHLSLSGHTAEVTVVVALSKVYAATPLFAGTVYCDTPDAVGALAHLHRSIVQFVRQTLGYDPHFKP